ncbi:MAG TPA: DUF3459 domain-containing protein, partial [Candidatus Limnocylindrales bacterium]|nr:DUF3459 domain-containing protein [Candidatus Limnocylindrales bacterium]
PRALSRYMPEGDVIRARLRARLAAMMLLTLRGTPFIYYGEEIGMSDAPIPRNRVVDVAGRDPERTPTQWDGSPNAGFSAADGLGPWLPVNPESPIVNVEAQRGDPQSMLSLYRTLIRVRRSSPALRRGSYVTVAAPRDVFAYLREADGERRLVLLNFGERHARVTLARALAGTDADAGAAKVVLSTDPARPQEPLGKVVEVGPEEGLLLEV